MNRISSPNAFKEDDMNPDEKDTDNSVNTKDDESTLERIGKKIVPPSRETSDAELIDPGANSPTPLPENPAKSPEVKRRP
jgi:hypothetical protein